MKTIMERIGHFLDTEVISNYEKLKRKGVDKSDMPPFIEKNLDIQKVLKKASKKWDGGYVIAGINIESLPIYSFGYVYLPALIGISITSVFGAKYGAMLAHYLSQETLKNIMAGWFFIVSIYMILV